MHPELVKLGPLPVHSYGFMMMLAFFLGIMLAVRRARRAGIGSAFIWDLSIWILFSSLIGARALYVLTHVEEFRGHWLDVINPVQGDGRFGIAGMVLLGGVGAAVIVSIWYIRRRKLPLWKVADVMAPSLALGIALGRIGCYLNGCCYGIASDFCGVKFPGMSQAVLPTQLFEAFWCALLLVGLLLAERWKRFEGYTFALFLLGYAVFRLWVETVRDDSQVEILFRLTAGRITISQVLSAGMIVWGAWLWTSQRRRGRLHAKIAKRD